MKKLVRRLFGASTDLVESLNSEIERQGELLDKLTVTVNVTKLAVLDMRAVVDKLNDYAISKDAGVALITGRTGRIVETLDDVKDTLQAAHWNTDRITVVVESMEETLGGVEAKLDKHMKEDK